MVGLVQRGWKGFVKTMSSDLPDLACLGDRWNSVPDTVLDIRTTARRKVVKIIWNTLGFNLLVII